MTLKYNISKGQHIIDIPVGLMSCSGEQPWANNLSLKALGKFKKGGQKTVCSLGSQEVIRMLPSGRCQLPGMWLFKGSELDAAVGSRLGNMWTASEPLFLNCFHAVIWDIARELCPKWGCL